MGRTAPAVGRFPSHMKDLSCRQRNCHIVCGPSAGPEARGQLPGDISDAAGAVALSQHGPPEETGILAGIEGHKGELSALVFLGS